MGFPAIGAGIAAALRAGASGAVNSVKGISRAAKNPTDAFGKIADAETLGTKGTFSSVLGREVFRELFPAFENKIRGLLGREKPEPLRDTLEIEEVVEIQCTDKKTGRVNTHTFIINRRDLSSALQNPQELVRDAGLEGCSGEEGKDVGINVSVL